VAAASASSGVVEEEGSTVVAATVPSIAAAAALIRHLHWYTLVSHQRSLDESQRSVHGSHTALTERMVVVVEHSLTLNRRCSYAHEVGSCISVGLTVGKINLKKFRPKVMAFSFDRLTMHNRLDVPAFGVWTKFTG
jgi:hypothetical protein